MSSIKYAEIKPKNKFVKIFNTDIRKLFNEGKVSDLSLTLLVSLSAYLEYPDNVVKIAGEFPTRQVLTKRLIEKNQHYIKN